MGSGWPRALQRLMQINVRGPIGAESFYVLPVPGPSVLELANCEHIDAQHAFVSQ
jgi:hypothetical protein